MLRSRFEDLLQLVEKKTNGFESRPRHEDVCHAPHTTVVSLPGPLPETRKFSLRIPRCRHHMGRLGFHCRDAQNCSGTHVSVGNNYLQVTMFIIPRNPALRCCAI